ncbi:transaldolase family protein [Eubacterium barkeri]|uniref:Transaldolase n=1 Tax=Eubacterium barkeri TaxID=1528 RepID=A0A1H3HPJ5_EUBBA|nr:transaldolase family protein [Eubacterium barkeri]SDY16718.1 Transaldolase [Eubacterium barkeri]
MNINWTLKDLNLPVVSGEEALVARVQDLPLTAAEFNHLTGRADRIGVTPEFKKVIETYPVPEWETPAGFKAALGFVGRVLRVDLVRDISYDKNSVKRPTNVLFSADSANPYEVAPIADYIANLTCNPGIIYDLFINNPKANVGGQFKTRDEVMAEIGRILGPGADISVELNDPFGKSDAEILEEAAKFKEMLGEHRVVIKVPHTGPVNAGNVGSLLTGDKRLATRHNAPSTADAFRGHHLALMLHEHGYRVNFTLMFEPWQTALALQARPYFINSFIRHRLVQSTAMEEFLGLYRDTKDVKYLEQLRSFMVDKDYFCASDLDVDLNLVRKEAETMLKHRAFNTAEGQDGLDGVRQNLRLLRQSNLPDTRLIICSMEGPDNYPDIDRLLSSDEYGDMAGRVVITAEPGYLARFTSANQVVSYQRRFMNAANGMS